MAVRAVLAPLVTFFLRPTVVGALYVVALAARAGTHVREDPTLGNEARQISDFVHGAYGSEIARVTIAIVAAAVVIGAALGFIAGLLVCIRDRVGRAAPRSLLGRAGATLGVTAALHGTVELWAMARNPQLYVEGWYARGGLLRTVQVIATDVLGPTGVVVFGMVAIVASWSPTRPYRVLPGG